MDGAERAIVAATQVGEESGETILCPGRLLSAIRAQVASLREVAQRTQRVLATGLDGLTDGDCRALADEARAALAEWEGEETKP